MLKRIIEKCSDLFTSRPKSLIPQSIKIINREDFLHLNEYSVYNTSVSMFSENNTYIEVRPIHNEEMNGHSESYYFARIAKGRLRYRGYNYFLDKTIELSKHKKNSDIIMFYRKAYRKALRILKRHRYEASKLLISKHIDTGIEFKDLYVCVCFSDSMICGVPNINIIYPFNKVMYRAQYLEAYEDFNLDEIKL